MTNKQERILSTALELFAEEGFKATPTSKVAKKAGVSEGLIFRHFGSKDGLLEAILKLGEEKLKDIYSNIIFESDPKSVIEKTISLIENIKDSPQETTFWKLQYKIKWEIELYNQQKTEPLELALANAFGKLNYENPKQEAVFLMTFIDGLATKFFLQKDLNIEEMIQYLKKKYE